MSKRSAPRATEHQEQCAVVAWFNAACKGYGLPPYALFANVNGAHLAGDARGRAIKMANLKRAGLRPGVPDLILLTVRYDEPSACALLIEMKRKPNQASAAQLVFLAWAQARGYRTVVAWNAEEAIRAIKDYLA